MNDLEFSRKRGQISCGLLLLIVTACNTSTETPGPVRTVKPTDAVSSSTWVLYTNEPWKFSVEHPTAWVITLNGTDSGFIGKQVFWWVGNYDPMQQHGDDPAVDEMTEIDIDGQQAIRVSGYYQGAIGDMGYQQYLKYVVHKGDAYYMFTLYAVDALGVPSNMMNERQPLHENDVELFEQMIATVKFSE